MFNSEKYITLTIDSVIHQDQHNIKYEIIIIDDASIDQSISIVKNFQFDFIKLIPLKKNEGTANARNIGVKNAKGDWIIFLDSDDRLSSNLFANFSQMYDSKYNCYLFGFIREYYDFHQIQTITRAEDKRAFGLFGTVCNKVIHKSIFIDFKIEYSFEDICFIIDMLNQQQLQVNIIKDSYYLYNKLNPESKMTNFNVVEYKKMISYVFSQIKCSDKLTKMFILEVFVGIIFSKEIPLKLSIPIVIKTLIKLFFYLPSVIFSQSRFWIDTKTIPVKSK